MNCHSCGTELVPAAQFCHECGARASGQAGIERRVVSVVFADLVGFTAISAQLDPEDVRELLTRYFGTATSIVRRYGGSVEKFIGDAVMAVWGAPKAHEDDPERAVRAALDLIKEIPQLFQGQDIRLRAAVVTGEAAVTLGARNQGMVAGDTVNTASRLQNIAPPGGVVVDDVTRLATELAIEYEDMGLHDLKGKPEPVQAWRALQRAVGVQPIRGPLTGRDEEIAALQAAFESCMQSAMPHMAVVVGRRGTGKTRLMEEAGGRILATSGDPLICWGRSEQYERHALGPWRQILARLLTDDELGAPSRDAIVRAVDQSGMDAGAKDRAVDALGSLLGLGPADGADQAEIGAALRAVLEGIARDRPLVLILDDVQWADRRSIEVCEQLLQFGADVRLLLLVGSHPPPEDEVPFWAQYDNDGSRTVVLTLDSLAQAAIVELLTDMLPDVEEEVKQQLARSSEGMPLYVMEMLRMLLANGQLSLADNGALVAARLGRPEMPQSIQLLAAARLDALSAEARELVGVASVIGPVVTKDLLVRVTDGSASSIDSRVNECLRHEVLRRTGGDADGYEFVQHLLQRAAYDRMSRDVCAALHLRTAEVLAALPDAQDRVESISDHFLAAYRLRPRADIKASAAEWISRAAHHAAALGSAELALSRYDAAVDMAEAIDQLAELHVNAALMFEVLGNSPAAVQRLRKALVFQKQLGDVKLRAETLSAAAVNYSMSGRSGRALTLLLAAHRAVKRTTPPASSVLVARRLALSLCKEGRPSEALAVIEEALADGEYQQEDAATDFALVIRGNILTELWRVREAEALFGFALQQSIDRGWPFVAWAAAYFGTFLYWRQGRFEKAVDSISEGVRMARYLGDGARVAELQTLQATLEFYRGAWNDASAIADAIEPKWVQTWPEVSPAHVVAKIAAIHGDLPLAREALAESKRYNASDDRECQANYWSAVAVEALCSGNEDAAAAAAAEVMSLLAGHGSHYLLAEALWIRGVVACRRGAKDVQNLQLELNALSPYRLIGPVRIQMLRLSAYAAWESGDHEMAIDRLQRASKEFRDHGLIFDFGLCLAELADLLKQLGNSAAAAMMGEGVAALQSLGLEAERVNELTAYVLRPWGGAAALRDSVA